MMKKRVLCIVISALMIFALMPFTVSGATADNSISSVGCDPIWFEIDALLSEAYPLIDDPAYTPESRMALKEVVEYTEEIFFNATDNDLYNLQSAMDALIPIDYVPFVVYAVKPQEWDNLYIYGFIGTPGDPDSPITMGVYPGTEMEIIGTSEDGKDICYATIPDDTDHIKFCDGNTNTTNYRTNNIPVTEVNDGDLILIKPKDASYSDKYWPYLIIDLYEPETTVPETTIPETDPTEPGTTIPETDPTEPDTTISETDPTEPGTTIPETDPTEPDTTIRETDPTEPGTTIPETDPTEPGTTTPETEDKTPDLPPALYGDADLNNSVNVKDATYIQKYLVGLKRISVHYLPIYDVDRSGDLDIRDATTIQKYVANIIDNTIINTYYSFPSTRPTEATEETYTECFTEPPTTDHYEDFEMECECWKYTGMLADISDAYSYLDQSHMYTPESIANLRNIVEYAEGVTDFDEAYEMSSLIRQAIIDLVPAPTDNVNFEQNYDCSGRIEGYDESYQNVLYLVNSTEELEEVLSGIHPYKYKDYDYADLTDIRTFYNEEFFEKKSLLISLCCIGGTGCYQYFDRIKRYDNTLTLYSFISAPENIPPDMNYNLGVLEISKADATGITKLVHIMNR